MVAYDILVIEWSETGELGFVATELYLLKVTEFAAVGVSGIVCNQETTRV
jgi:hypothetical protein